MELPPVTAGRHAGRLRLAELTAYYRMPYMIVYRCKDDDKQPKR